MKKFQASFLRQAEFASEVRKPDFSNLLKVLKGEKPDRFTLFEFFLNDVLYKRLARDTDIVEDDLLRHRLVQKAYEHAGYDYFTIQGSNFHFPTNRSNHGKASVSMNEGNMIYDRESFEKYPWPDPKSLDYSRLEILGESMPEGMKMIVWGPGGVLENVIALVGYETLCYMIMDEPELVQDIFDAIGSRMVQYYEICSRYDTVGALISNDDWGFNSQTMLSTPDMEKYVIKWHRKIAETIHASGKPAILHSCGQLVTVMDHIIDDIKYDAKHSYEDKITPVEDAYRQWGRRITILGGIDMDFVCRSTPEAIYDRACGMLELSSEKGGYALGSGNSIPPYVPHDNYFAMIAAAVVNA